MTRKLTPFETNDSLYIFILINDNYTSAKAT